MNVTVKSRVAIMALAMAALTACTSSNPGDINSSSTPLPAVESNVGLPAPMQACMGGLMAPGCDKKAAGTALAGMSENQAVLGNFNSPTVGRMTMRFTADGLRYGTDVVSCQDINNQAGAWDAAVRPGAAADLGAFIKTISADQARMKGCA